MHTNWTLANSTIYIFYFVHFVEKILTFVYNGTELKVRCDGNSRCLTTKKGDFFILFM